MKKINLIFLVLVFTVGCTSHQQKIPGVYKSKNLNVIERKWKHMMEGYDAFIIGLKLDLNTDSTFQMTTCGNYLTGSWYSENDTFFLKYETNKWVNDSLQQFGFQGEWAEVPKSIEKVKLRGQKLIFNWQSRDNFRTYDVL